MERLNGKDCNLACSGSLTSEPDSGILVVGQGEHVEEATYWLVEEEHDEDEVHLIVGFDHVEGKASSLVGMATEEGHRDLDPDFAGVVVIATQGNIA